jgi:hypothetical protein
MPPHIYAMATKVYRSVMMTGISLFIVWYLYCIVYWSLQSCCGKIMLNIKHHIMITNVHDSKSYLPLIHHWPVNTWTWKVSCRHCVCLLSSVTKTFKTNRTTNCTSLSDDNIIAILLRLFKWLIFGQVWTVLTNN